MQDSETTVIIKALTVFGLMRKINNKGRFY
jgi:hypothetical protein